MRRLPHATGVRGELVALAALFAVSVGWKVVALRLRDLGRALAGAAARLPRPLRARHGARRARRRQVAPADPAGGVLGDRRRGVLGARDAHRLHGSTSDHLTSARYLARHELNAVIAVALVAPVALGALRGRAARVFELRPVVFVGVISYGIYLYHVGVLVLLLEQGLLPVDTGSRVAFLAIAAPASILLGWASYRIVERPCIALGRRLAGDRRAAAGWRSAYAASSGG
jgi:hypothetical protein